MFVDDSLLMLRIVKEVLGTEYDLVTLNSALTAIEALEMFMPDLLILDINMPDMDGFEFFDWLKNNPRFCNIPVIFLSGADRDSAEIQALEAGAMDYIAKPFNPEFLRKRVSLYTSLAISKRAIEEKNKKLEEYSHELQHMVEDKTKEVIRLRDAIFLSIGDIVENRDHLTGGHIKRTGEYVYQLARNCIDSSIYPDLISEEYLQSLTKVAPLHDIGKIEIPDSILLKPGKLTISEFNIMKSHTVVGYQILAHMAENVRESNELYIGMNIALSHHEQWDGSGYPNGLRGDAIPICGRLMAIADVYDALISKRSYKESYSHEQAVEIIVSESGKHFDPQLVKVFLEINEKFDETAKLYSQTILAK